MGLDRAYMYFFNDEDSASVHGSSGLTRHYEPKPSYWAQSHLQQTLGDFRFTEALKSEEGGLYHHVFAHEEDPTKLIWVLWLATGDESTLDLTLEDLPGNVVRAERMPLGEGAAPQVDFERLDGGSIRLNITESPTYLWITIPEPAGAMLFGGAG